MTRKKSKRILAIVSLLLVMTVLFCGNVFARGAELVLGVNGTEVSGNVGNEGVSAYVTSSNTMKIKKVTVYPAYAYIGKMYHDTTIFYSQSHSPTQLVAMTISAAKRADLANKISAKGYVQSGWHVKIDYVIDAVNPVSLNGRGQDIFKFAAKSGDQTYSYDTPNLNSIPAWEGTFTYITNKVLTARFCASFSLR